MKSHLQRLCRGEALGEEQAMEAMADLMDGDATAAQIGALLAAIAVRGETEDEVVGFARTMRARAVPLESRGAVDTCGTGGDGAGTFNISTVASFVVAACGAPVAKHGNRSASGTCGSADVLEALGIRIDAPTPVVQKALDSVGWTFLFAPRFHAATRHAALPRKELGVRTAFNLLGPLTNPARPEAQVVGVPRAELAPFVARCLQRLGTKRAWVVNGSGLDELTLAGPTTVAELDGGSLRSFTVSAEDAGLAAAPLEALRGGDPQANAAIARDVLAGVRRELGVHTTFNLLGPLTNPAGAPRQVIGVWHAALVEPLARALGALGTERAWIVHGRDGLDEVTVARATSVAEVAGGEVRLFDITPRDFGLDTSALEDLRGGDAEANARIIRSILSGERRDAGRDLVIANAAAALHVGGAAEDLRAAARLAAESLDGGAASAKLEQLAHATNA